MSYCRCFITLESGEKVSFPKSVATRFQEALRRLGRPLRDKLEFRNFKRSIGAY
jgi:hypothetical protein